MNMLRENNTELSRYLLQGDYSKDIKFSVTSYEGRKFVMVPPNRFRTNIDLTGFGYKFGDGSQAIDFMVVATDAVIHVVKYNKVKILSGDIVLGGQNFDGYSIYARIYHDVFVPDNKRFGIYAHISNTTAPKAKLIVEIDDERKVTNLVSYPAEKLTRYVTSTTQETENTTPKGTLTTVKVGSVLADNTTVYAIVDGVVVASHTVA